VSFVILRHFAPEGAAGKELITEGTFTKRWFFRKGAMAITRNKFTAKNRQVTGH
jgi:hypothetical protein